MTLGNDGMADARRTINPAAGSRRLLTLSIIAPGKLGWMDEIERAIAEIKPDSWKGYTVGDPFGHSRFAYRPDDKALMSPAYGRMLAWGMTNICIREGLLPADHKHEFPTWEHARADDVGKAARDWPQLNVIIYHSAFRPFLTTPDRLVQQFDETGRIDWVSDHVIWGTDSVWYGSPQWQIEAMRRMEIPQDMRKAHNFAALGEAEGEVKSAIFQVFLDAFDDVDLEVVTLVGEGGRVASERVEKVRSHERPLSLSSRTIRVRCIGSSTISRNGPTFSSVRSSGARREPKKLCCRPSLKTTLNARSSTPR